MRTTSIILSLALAPLLAHAQSPLDDPQRASLAAGYKAAFTCSAHFNAGRAVDEIAGHELARIYPDYREALAALPEAAIDEEAKTVSVRYGESMPARVAAWRPHLGCAQLPTGADPAMASALPRAKVKQTRVLPRPLPENLSDEANFLAAIDAAFDGATYGEGTQTSSVLVVKDGAVIAEKYRDGFDQDTPQRTWSVAKSIAASVIGAAVYRDIIAVEDDQLLEAWSEELDPRREIKLENLLHMSSGLGQDTAGNRTDDVYFGGGRVIDHAITNRLVAAPGARWRYANNDTMAAMRALRERMNDDDAYLAFPFEALLHPIGMVKTFPETDWNGDFIFSSQVWTTPRDLARLGLLYLNDGVWEGRRILPEGWADYVARPAPAQPEGADGAERPGYGAQWWLYGEEEGLPQGTYAARGNRGQYLFVAPERDMLIIRRGYDDNGGAPFEMARFARDVLTAFEQ